MVLKNYKVILASKLFHNWNGMTGGSIGDTISSWRNINGNSYNTCWRAGVFDSSNQAVVSGCLGDFGLLSARFGTGTTPPTADDYKLETDITGSFANINVAKSYNLVGDNYDVEALITFNGKNNTANDIILSEIGLCFTRNWINGNDYSNYPVMVYREVLDTPVTVAPNQTVTFTLKWTEG